MCQPCADATARPPRRPRSSLARDRHDVALHIDAVDDEPSDPAAPPHRDLVRRTAEAPPRGEPGPRRRQARVDAQPVVVGTDAEDPLRDRDVVPRRSPGQPRVLRLAVGRRVAARDHLRVDVGLAAVDLADLLARRRVDAQVVVERARPLADDRRRDDHPRVGVAEDAGVLLVAGRVRRDLAELDVVPLVGGLQQHDAVRGGELLGDRVERRRRSAVLDADAGHHADALRLDEDLPLVVSPSRPACRRSRRRAGTTRRPSRARARHLIIAAAASSNRVLMP